LFILSSFLLWTCSKDDPIIIYEAGPQTDGWAIGIKSGHEWEASASARLWLEDSTTFSISFLTYSPDGLLRESFGISGMSLRTGSTPIKYDQSQIETGTVRGNGGILGSDGDLAEAFYTANNDKDGFVDILSIDTVSNIVTGKFELFLNLKQNYGENDHPNKIEIEEGSFEVQIIN